MGPPLAPRALYASDPNASRGRIHSEAPSPTRTEFQRDRDRIVHCAAFRRLAHKAQVFVSAEGDHFRTRLTHSIEVSQVARALCRSLRLDEDLAETLALAHDIGHACFGHAGEDALAACMRDFGGFDHNAQALRLVTALERRYARYDGLNLAWESVEGLVKHNGPLIRADGAPVPRYEARGAPQPILDLDARWPLDLANYSSAEAQAAAIADDIAYNAHDIDDGLRSGVVEFDALLQVDFIRDLVAEVDGIHPGLEQTRRTHELVRRIITRFVEGAIEESGRRLAEINAQSPADVRSASAAVVGFPPALQQADRDLKKTLTTLFYRHPKLMRMRQDAAEVVTDLFVHFTKRPHDMPEEWAAACGAAGAAFASAGEARRAHVICDYIAGMTDRYALQEHIRLFGFAPSLR